MLGSLTAGYYAYRYSFLINLFICMTNDKQCSDGRQTHGNPSVFLSTMFTIIERYSPGVFEHGCSLLKANFMFYSAGLRLLWIPFKIIVQLLSPVNPMSLSNKISSLRSGLNLQHPFPMLRSDPNLKRDDAYSERCLLTAKR